MVRSFLGDGDQMNIILALDNVTSEQLETLAPHKNMYDLNVPRTLSNAASLPKPVISTISNWIHYQEQHKQPDSDKLHFLESLSI